MTSKLEDTLSKDWVTDFLAQPYLARMATCDPHTHQPHVVPVWYEWDGKYLWISSFRSTRKVKELIDNPLISITIDWDQRGEPARGVIIEGKAELVTEREIVEKRSTQIYTRYLGEDGVLAPEPQSWIYDAENLVIRVTPHWASAW